MSPKKIERLIKTLREQGVEYIKTPEIEIRLKDMPGVLPVVRTTDPDLSPAQPLEPVVRRPSVAPETPAAAPPVITDIPHHENQVAKLLKLSDEDLVDRLFPDYTQGTG